MTFLWFLNSCFLGVTKKLESGSAHSDSEVDDLSTTSWKQLEFRVPGKPLPSRSAHLSTEPPIRYPRRTEMLRKSVTDESETKATGCDYRQSQNSLSLVNEVAQSAIKPPK